MKNKEEVSVFEKVTTILKMICVIVLLMIIAVLALQRFSNNKIAVGGIRIFNVATESMVPEYEVGDVLLVKEIDANSLKKGDDITYLGEQGSFENRVVTHRIVDIEEIDGEKVYHTKGIANDVEDPTITADRIYGKVIYKCIIIKFWGMNKILYFFHRSFLDFKLDGKTSRIIDYRVAINTIRKIVFNLFKIIRRII